MATVMELKARADAYGLRNYDRLNKTQLESLISKHDQLACEQHKPIPQPVIFRFEVNELYYDNFAGFIVIERTDTHVTFKNIGSEKVSCRKVSITRTHVGYCETATLTNYNGERCYPTARPTSKTDDAFSKVKREISIRKAKEAYASFLQGQCVDSVPKTTRITVMTVEQAVEAIQSATTAEEVQAVLEQCKKDQLHEVVLAVTGAENELCAKSWKKAELVSQYTARIVAFKAREAFSTMDAETRAEYLASGKFQQEGNTVDKLTWKLSPYELITLNAALGVSFEEYKDIHEDYHAITSLKSCIRRAVKSARYAVKKESPVAELSRPETEGRLDYDTAFDETAYTPDVQEGSVIVDDIPADHEPDMQEDSEISSYVVGKQIVSLKGDAKAQQALLKSCGNEFLLAMFGVFYAPVRVHMDTPDELRKWMCKGVLKAVRDPSYAGILLRNVRIDIKKKTHVKRAYLEGWAKFLSEYACPADQQKILAVLDDIPADHEPNTAPVQEASAPTYEAMRAAYEAYLDAEDKYLTSRKTDIAEKAKSDEAFRQYLTLLGRYRQEGMPEREEALNWIREYCEGKLFPVDSLKGRSFDELTELAHKCGLHEAFFKECDTRHDLAVKLIREAGIEDSEKTSYERKVEERKELQGELHKLWQKRHALLKAQRIFGEGSADAEALSDVWDEYHDQADVLLGEYWRICEELSLLRERKRKYEADSQRADTLAMAEAVVSKELELQPAQIIKPKATISLKKKPHKISRKSHTPRWVQSLQVKSKASRNSLNSKPLMKPTKAASTIRVRKF